MSRPAIEQTFSCVVPGKALDGQGDVNHEVRCTVHVESHHAEAARKVMTAIQAAWRDSIQPPPEPEPAGHAAHAPHKKEK